jgi:microcystin-dependent protein
MPRNIFEDGDILYADQVNQIAYPIPDGEDFIGRGPKVIDDYLSDESNQIKSRFYGFYNRLRLTEATGLSLTHSGGSVLLSDASIVSIPSGSITLANNATSFVYVDETGAISSSNILPNECFPIAKVTTVSGSITELIDLRDKLLDRVTPSSIPDIQSIPPGAGMEYYGSTLPSGWLWQNGATYNIADYPNLFNAIGYTYGGSGSTFKVPDRRGRVAIGAGQGAGLTNRILGNTLGVESVTLVVSQMPPHTHSINDPGHNHGVNQSPHSHPISDPGHSHSVFVNWTDGDGGAREKTDGLSKPNTGITGEDSGGKLYANTNGSGNSLIANTASNVSVLGSTVSISISSSSSNISANTQGGGQAHQNMQPSIVCNFIIKT